ncbi:MAG: AraC family transcriptional regulator [Xanthomonadales bacterium]|nr:AraC family transcriptional regulator [Xanthomonadales bacterium]
MHRRSSPDTTVFCEVGDSSVRVGPMVNIASTLSELGQNPDEVFDRVGLNVGMYSDPDQRVTYLRSGRLFAEAASATGCDYFGLLAGQASRPSHLGIVGFLVRTAETVGDALESFVEYLDLHDKGGTLDLSKEGEYCQLSFHVHQMGVQGIDQAYDFSAAIMQRIMQSLCGENWTATEVLLPRKKPADEVPYRRLFQSIIIYDADVCALSFPCSQLDRTSSTADSLLFRHLQHEAKLLHRAYEKRITDFLPTVLRHGLLTESFSAQEISQKLGLSERTLHRQLKVAGTSFRTELDKERMAVAMQLLEATSLAVCDIAQSLGYSNSSSFNRAFRRWAEFSPSEWRKRNRPLGMKRRRSNGGNSTLSGL